MTMQPHAKDDQQKRARQDKTRQERTAHRGLKSGRSSAGWCSEGYPRGSFASRCHRRRLSGSGTAVRRKTRHDETGPDTNKKPFSAKTSPTLQASPEPSLAMHRVSLDARWPSRPFRLAVSFGRFVWPFRLTVSHLCAALVCAAI
jgi:hypothetical protein